MKHIYRDAIYTQYMTNGFGDIHSNTKHRKRECRYFKKNYLKFIPSNKEGQILDLGCGAGEFVQFLTDAGYKNVVGVDVSQENISYCKKMNSNADFIQKEAGDFLRDHENEYDCIVFNDIIEHLDKDEIYALLTGIYKSLKMEGVY